MHANNSLVFLRDPFTSALIAMHRTRALVNERQDHGDGNRAEHMPEEDAFAVYVLTTIATAAVVPLESTWRHCAVPPLYLGTVANGGVFLAVPLPGITFAGATLTWGLYAQSAVTRQYVAQCRIAHLQTIGGGWASLRRADKALQCAMALYYLATQVVHDGDIASKSRVFIGWAHLWNGDVAKAIALFELELQEALSRADLVHERRCRHAIINATTNLQLLTSLRRGAFSLTDCWTNAFTSTEIQEVDDLASALQESSAPEQVT